MWERQNKMPLLAVSVTLQSAEAWQWIDSFVSARGSDHQAISQTSYVMHHYPERFQGFK